MQLVFTKPFVKDYRNLPAEIQKRVDKQLGLLLRNPKHSSLRIKKIRGTKDIWEASVTMKYRLTLQFAKDTCVLRRVGKHDKALDKP